MRMGALSPGCHCQNHIGDDQVTEHKEYYGVRYSDAYEVYGLTRTGCCGCPISYKAVDDLEKTDVIQGFSRDSTRAAERRTKCIKTKKVITTVPREPRYAELINSRKKLTGW